MVAYTCIICNGSDAKFCSSCHSISYCSPECQNTDWPLHKTICKSFATLPARPSSSHKLAILLPVSSRTPELIWVHCEHHIEDEENGGGEWELPDLDSVLDTDDVLPKYKRLRCEYKPITRNALRGFNFDHTVVVMCRDAFLIDGSKRNYCVVATTRGKVAHDWGGPIVVMRQPGTACDTELFEDITAGDLRVAVDYFVAYGRDE
jgi:hypothetical protein